MSDKSTVYGAILRAAWDVYSRRMATARSDYEAATDAAAVASPYDWEERLPGLAAAYVAFDAARSAAEDEYSEQIAAAEAEFVSA